MTRLELFEAQQSHPVNGKLYRQLNEDEREICRHFIRCSAHLDRDAFALKVNRWFVDDSMKPKNHTTMWALVSQCLGE